MPPGCANAWSLRRPPLAHECSVLGSLGLPRRQRDGQGLRSQAPAWAALTLQGPSCCYCFVLACHPLRVAWAGAWKCMSEQFLITFHLLPNFLSLLSIEILWAGHKMG